VLKKTRIAAAVGTIATGVVLIGSPAHADGPTTVNQVNNIVPITFCDNQVAVAVAAIQVPINNVLSPKTVTCSTAITYQWG
jgi:hypothetical protein